MPDASPTKWHLAHTTWFFETFVLRPHAPAIAPSIRPTSISSTPTTKPSARGIRGRSAACSRGRASRRSWPIAGTSSDAMAELLDGGSGDVDADRRARPASRAAASGADPDGHQASAVAQSAEAGLSRRQRRRAAPATPLGWRDFEGGLVEIGHDGEGFAFDNEGPRHRVWLEPFALASRPTNCGEYLAFIEDGGYRRPEFWLSAGWDCVNQRGWSAPLYWEQDGDELARLHPVGPAAARSAEPVCHVSVYRGRRLRQMGGQAPAARGGVGGGRLGARRTPASVWEWTASPYVAYPGYREPAGAIGEYNGKFMANQMVLRGGCAATPRRPYPPDLSQLLPARCALDVRRHSPRGGSPMNGSPLASRPRRAGRPRGIPAMPCWRACRRHAARHSGQVPLRRARLGAVRRDLRAARVLPDAHRDRDPAQLCRPTSPRWPGPAARWSSSAAARA